MGHYPRVIRPQHHYQKQHCELLHLKEMKLCYMLNGDASVIRCTDLFKEPDNSCCRAKDNQGWHLEQWPGSGRQLMRERTSYSLVGGQPSKMFVLYGPDPAKYLSL